MSKELPRATTADPDKLIGEVLANRYQIEHRLGEGAMGVVYKARHVKMGRPFAIKVLHPQFLSDVKIAQRFEREAELAARLRHPNVIGVVDVGETPDGLRYMVMDFVEGPDLATLLGEAPMPPPRIIHLVRQLLEGLYHAHEEGLIHRDFKPENVIVERDTHGAEVPRIVDFGISILREGGTSSDSPGRLTTNGLVLGTPHYMAPEQAVADPVDHRIDLFALGIVIYEMLSGKLPFDGSGAEVARANLMLDPPLISQRVPFLEVDPLLEAFARKLMAKSRTSRPPTAKAAREILDLIERDRAAAAAALGVPVETGIRPPQVTAPVAPSRSDQDETARVTPPQAPPMPATVAKPVHDASRPADAKQHVDGTAATALDSDHLSASLVFDRPSGNRGMLLIAGVVTLAIVSVAVVIFATRGGHDVDLPPPQLPPTIAVIETPVEEPRPKPPPVEEPKPSPEIKDPPPTPEIKDPPPTDTPQVKPAIKQPMTRPRDTHPTPTHVIAPPAHDIAPKHDLAPPVPTQGTAPDHVVKPDDTQTVKPAEPKPSLTPEQLLAKQIAAEKTALSELYAKVGREIGELRSAKGDKIANQLNESYRRVQFYDSLATTASRAAAMALLNEVHAKIIAAMQ